MTEKIEIKTALGNEHVALTRIANIAKRHWNYPDEYYDIWEKELTIIESYICENMVYVAEYEREAVGFYSIVENKEDRMIGEIFVQKGYWLEHLFVLPVFHKKGIGRKLILHARSLCSKTGIDTLFIFVDPYAKGFYEKIGSIYLYESVSSIPGRKIPVYQLII